MGSSSKSKLEVAVNVAVKSEVMLALNKLEKKRQKASQKKMHEERIVNNFIRVGTTRSCRSSKPINYTFGMKTKPKEEERSKKKVTVLKEDSEQSCNRHVRSPIYTLQQQSGFDYFIWLPLKFEAFLVSFIANGWL